MIRERIKSWKTAHDMRRRKTRGRKSASSVDDDVPEECYEKVEKAESAAYKHLQSMVFKQSTYEIPCGY